MRGTEERSLFSLVWCFCQPWFSILDLCSQPIDLVLALDVSSSINPDNYFEIKQFTKELVNGFDIGYDKTHVGILIFSTRAEKQIGLTDTYDRNELQAKIDRLPFRGDGTAIDDALRLANNAFFSLTGGARQGIPHIMILITDGACNACNEPVEDAAQTIKDGGVIVYTIGVGNQISTAELEIISSSLFFNAGWTTLKNKWKRK